MTRATHFLLTLAIVLLLAACGGGGDVGTPGAPESSPATTSGPAADQNVNCTSVDSCFAQGNEFARQNDLSKALASYQSALAINPNHAATLSNLGVVYYQLGQLADAKIQFEKALAINPQDAATNYLLGATLLQNSDLSGAESALTRALEIDPTLPEARFGMGMLRQMQGRVDDAIAEFEAFLAGPPAQDPRARTEAESILKSLRGQ